MAWKSLTWIGSSTTFQPMLVGLADDLAALDAAAGHPEAEGERMMVAAGDVAKPARFSPSGVRPNSDDPDHQRRVEQAALLQVLEQRRHRLIGHAAVERQLLVEVAVMVPRGVIQVDEAHAALDQPAGQQAVGGEAVVLTPAAAAAGPRLAIRPVDAVRSSVSFVSPLRSISSGAGRLHAEGQFVRRDAAVDFRIAEVVRAARGSGRASASIVLRCMSAVRPSGLLRLSTGSPWLRKRTPWYVVGRKPLDQLEAPPLVPRPAVSTT